MSNTVQVKINYYYFNVSKLGQAEAYAALMEIAPKITWETNQDFPNNNIPFDQEVLNYWKNIGEQAKQSPVLNIETDHLFNNQWNTKEGFRVRMHHVVKWPNKDIKQGYFLTNCESLNEVLRNTHKCGYCGKQEPAQKGYVFCPHCIDSENLTVKNLPLTRMAPVSEDKRAELSDAEKEYLLPVYKKAQKEGATIHGKARIAKKKADIESEYNTTIHKAKIKRDAALWILKNCPQIIDNWIYYDHKKVHCFGWRNPVDDEMLSDLLDVISEFPFDYEIITNDQILNG